MRHYPMFVNLENRICLVVGAGDVGMRKIRSLLDCGADQINVIDARDPGPEAGQLLSSANVSFSSRGFAEDDLDGVFLVIACTSNAEVNGRIADLCNERGILCNIADQPEKSSFIVPATVRRGDLAIAVSTGGHSPAVAKRIRKELQEYFGEEYATFLALKGRIRPLVLGLGLKTEDNTRVFRALAYSDLLTVLKGRDLDAAGEILKESLPDQLHASIPELLDGLV